MIRFAWLQARTQTVLALTLVAVLAVVAAVTGVQLSHLYGSLVAHCTTGCDLARAQFLSHDRVLDQVLDLAARAAPILVGIFWGAPLIAREFEAGTHRLVWTQGVTRTRWLLTKLGLLALVTLVTTGLLTLTITWWYRVLDPLASNQYAVFDRRGLAPVGYALFALGVGALIGLVVRRTVPAMAMTLVTVVAARVAVTFWVRPALFSPQHASLPLTAGDQFGFESMNGSSVALVADGGGPPQAWTVASRMVTSSGHTASLADRVAFVAQHCPVVANPPADPTGGAGGIAHPVPGIDAAAKACTDLAVRTFHLAVTYQPASRYWAFQWLEAGIFTLGGLVAAAGCLWWVRRPAT